MTKPNAYRLLAAACLVAAATAGAQGTPCSTDPQSTGMRTRMERMHEQVGKAQTVSDPAEQRRLLDLHAKHMSEGMRELRRREPGLQPACHVELMQAMMEQMIAHQQAAEELGQR